MHDSLQRCRHEPSAALSLCCMSQSPFNDLVVARKNVCPSKAGLLFWAALKLYPGLCSCAVIEPASRNAILPMSFGVIQEHFGNLLEF